MKKFGMVLAFLAVALFSGPAMAEYEWCPWKDSTGILGKPNRSWRIGDVDTMVVNTAFTATELVGAGSITNPTREIYLPMSGWALDGGNDIDENTAPDIGDDDNIPSITWDSSGETGAIQQTFRLPSTYVSGLTLYCLISSDTDADTTSKLDWRIWVNGNGVVFDATAIEQAVVAAVTGALNTTHQVLTLTLDATGEAAVSAGVFVTVDLFNATTHASANLELKGVQGTYTSTM